MIRYCCESDYESVRKLWHSVFGDSYEDIDEFLDIIPVSNALGYFTDAGLVSMLFLIDSRVYIDSAEYRCKYIYAACTSADCRGRGYMGELLRFICSPEKLADIDFLTLVPANDGLFRYYGGFGFKNFLYGKEVSFPVSPDDNGFDRMVFDEPVSTYASSVTDEALLLNFVPCTAVASGEEKCIGMAYALSDRAKAVINKKVFFNLTMG